MQFFFVFVIDTVVYHTYTTGILYESTTQRQPERCKRKKIMDKPGENYIELKTFDFTDDSWESDEILCTSKNFLFKFQVFGSGNSMLVRIVEGKKEIFRKVRTACNFNYFIFKKNYIWFKLLD